MKKDTKERYLITLNKAHQVLAMEAWQMQAYMEFGKILGRLRQGTPCPISCDDLYADTGMPAVVEAIKRSASGPPAMANVAPLLARGPAIILFGGEIEVRLQGVEGAPLCREPLHISGKTSQRLVEWILTASTLETSIEKMLSVSLPIFQGTRAEIEGVLPGLLRETGMKAPKRPASKAAINRLASKLLAPLETIQEQVAKGLMLPDVQLPDVWLAHVNPNTVG